jgi:photosystem II stability/assembly factor-like uncharacterized protein
MSNQTHVYAGTTGHSAWFSENAGQTWIHPNSHSGMYLEARVCALASHPQQPNQCYAGTDAGVFCWHEDSARWTLLAPLPGGTQDVWAIAIHPLEPDTLIVGTRPAGFYRSVDAGRSWQALSALGLRQFSDINQGPTRVTQILFDPADPRSVWASVEIGGIYRSTDGGDHWTPSHEGLVSDDVHGLAIVTKPDGVRTFFATTNKGLHLSRNEGATWQFVLLDSPWQYTRAIVPRADLAGHIFLTNGNGPPGNTGRLLRSKDYGETWTPVTLPGTLNSTPWCVATDASDPLRLFLCTNLGQLFVSTDGGEIWNRLPHEFGEVRALMWRSLPSGTRQQPHSLTRPTAPVVATKIA